MGGQDWLTKDFYATLGVPKDADQAQIKKAYRSLARKWHPDQNLGDAKAEETFKEIGEAHAVLSDPEQRKQYDALRQMAGGGARFAAGPAGAGATGFDDLFGAMFTTGAPGESHIRYSTGSSGTGFEDLLGSMFASGAQHSHSPFASSHSSFGSPFEEAHSSMRGHARPQPSRGADRHAKTTLSFRKAITGATVRMTVDGKKVTARVPAGVRDGQKIRLRGKGRPGLHGGSAGDCVITVSVTPDSRWSREGDDLVLETPVSFVEAALGASIEVPLFFGGTRTVDIPAGSSSGEDLVIAGEGVRSSSTRGNMRLRLRVDVPRALNDAQREAVKALAEVMPSPNVRAGLFEETGRGHHRG